MAQGNIMIFPPQEGDDQARVHTGDTRKIGITGECTPYLSMHSSVFSRLGLKIGNELQAEMLANSEYHIDGDTGMITLEARIDLPVEPFDPMAVLTGEELIEFRESDDEQLPEDPPGRLPGTDAQ